jgi:hypothetical protein
MASKYGAVERAPLGTVAVLLEGDTSMRARLHNDKQIIDSIRSEYMRLKTEASARINSLYSNFSE